MSVNSMMNSFMAFMRYCQRHGWVDDVPRLEKLDVENVMKGRPLTEKEFEAMCAVVPQVVGTRPAASWQFVWRFCGKAPFA
jgi:hypothetical protein